MAVRGGRAERQSTTGNVVPHKREMGNTPSTIDTVGATAGTSTKDSRCDELREAGSDTTHVPHPAPPPKSQDKVDVTRARANYDYGLCVKACADAAKAAESARAAHAHAHTHAGTSARTGLDHVTRTAAYAELSYYRCVIDCVEAVDVVNTINGSGNGDGKEGK